MKTMTLIRTTVTIRMTSMTRMVQVIRVMADVMLLMSLNEGETYVYSLHGLPKGKGGGNMGKKRDSRTLARM